jgi:hypothetical protein
MYSTMSQTLNLSVLGDVGVTSCNGDCTRELTRDELAMVAGGEVTGSNK